MLDTLLRTKLFIPPLRPNLVPRQRLIERLNQGLQLGHKLTLISAPAGFGKTTVASEWVNQKAEGRGQKAEGGGRKDDLGVTSHLSSFTSHPSKVAWLSLDEGDNDATRFLAYLVAALQTLSLSKTEGIAPALGEGVMGMLESPQPLPIDSILTALLNEISTIPHKFILVLDDYQVIEVQTVDNALTFLVEHLPPQMHLVIATREDPDLPLARLRVRGQLTELRVTDLRFTASETAEFLNRVMGLGLSAEEVISLETRTEGWIAGLQLAALSMRGREDVSGFIRAFAGENRYIVDYLFEEVMQRQPERVRSFLIETSILNRLSGPLCEAITGQENGRALLEALERDNLFVVPLDDKRHWYRYHHLFADVLQVRLMDEQRDRAPALHLRASEWYEQNGLPSDSIRHALAAEDFERAADLAELAWPAWSGSFQSIVWLGWLKALPDEVVRTRPVLSVSYAWAFLNSGELEAAEARLLDAERWLEPATGMREQPETPPIKMVVVDEEQFRSLPVSLATARAYHAQATGDIPGTVKYAQRVLELLPEGDSKWRGDANALLGLAQWASGDVAAAHQTLSDGLAGMKPLDVIVGTFVLADMKMALGQLHAAIGACEHALRLAASQGEPMPIGTEDVYTGISKLHRERGDLETAAEDLLISKKLGEQIEMPDWQYRWCTAQARLMETLGDLDGALELLDEARRLYVRTPLPDLVPIAALKARIWITQGKMAEALNWARAQGLSDNDDLSYLREFEHITLARLLIARHKNGRADGTIHNAMSLIERLLQAADEGGRMGSVIEILVLQALAHEARGDTPPALVSLDRALTLAEPEGYVRIFVDEGPAMARLLYDAVSQGMSADYGQRLLAAFPAVGPEQAKPSKAQTPKSEWIEPLSEREIEVLQLISEGLTNQEIASRLYLSLHTIKVHARNIYGKLGVKNRTQAVAKGKALGILPSTYRRDKLR